MIGEGSTILRMVDVHASYGSVPVLRGVSLNIEQGEIVVLIGHHGSGRTAILKAICGLLPVARGKVLFDGLSIHGLTAEKIVGLGISYVDEMKLLFPAMSVIDNLILGAYHRHRRERRENIEQDIEAVYRLFPVLEERTRQYAGTLSGGEQQMLAIGRALMSRPKLLLLDCPTLGLAPKLAKKVVKVLAELRDQGITILLIDQKLQQVIDIADRGYVVEGGGIIRQDSPQALLSLEENNRFVSPKT
ncbi:High-affinity branched-chain amino acid transport ATP-binding protein LivF [subsurface metagenome]